ncbi:MAG: biotin carboxylase N-terminal domain-containing protein, partial [Acidimicrobiales bacterium]
MEAVELPRRVLIANRGEIATRIARAATALGIESVAVFAPADRLSLHTRVATEARELPAADESDPVAAYLDVDAIVEVGSAAGCDCIHPGYGFLSESPELASEAAAAGMTFIGPSPDALMLFGDKVAARAIAERVGVPTIPGSRNAVAGPQEAAAVAEEIGYPVMLKAAAGGGGRGIRRVDSADELPAALERCASEAEASFGDPAVFVEKLVERPRHIEVQVLGDASGSVLHLWERDCSIQLRNQKVVEIAPAPLLDRELRQRILDDAVRLIDAADYVNAGTVEFLVVPELGTYYFIECNPRIQVEHTVTEQVTGIDLVQAQFHLAAGASLAALGLTNQEAVPTPRGYAIQARVVARGAGTISAYKEPTGVGVRVDGNGYLGYTPPPQFDPLLAKVVASSTGFGVMNGADQAGAVEPAFGAALSRARAALEEFHVAGLPTNLEQLVAILSHPDVLAGDARTSLLNEVAELGAMAGGSTPVITRGSAVDSPIDLLTQQSSALGRDVTLGAGAAPLAEVAAATARAGAKAAIADGATSGAGLAVGEGQRAIECPMGATVVAVKAEEGTAVSAGQTLVVISAMKMETEVTAPVSGTVAAVGALETGDTVVAGQLLAVLEPGVAGNGAGAAEAFSGDGAEHTWGPTLEEVQTLQHLADERLSSSSEEPGVVRQRSRGKLHCRERIALLLDDGSFQEVGSVAGFASYDDYGDIDAFTPANHVGGSGTIEGRPAIVCADDFTSRGGHADGAIGAKSFHLDQLSVQLGIPSIRLLDGSSGGGSVAAMVPEQKKEGESAAKESSGAIKSGRPRVAGGGGSFLPGHLGSTEYAEQLATVPVVNTLLGSVVGIGAAKAVLGHFSVMVRDIAQLFVAGPPVVSHAMGYDITKEDLGDWRI